MEEDRRKKRGEKRHRLDVKGIKTMSLLCQKRHGIRSQLCQLVSKSDYAVIILGFSDKSA